MSKWKTLFGEPVIVLGAIEAGLQAVNWSVIHVLAVQIIVAVVLAVIGVLLARAQVIPVSKVKKP